MSNKSIATIATMGIDIGKNSFHVVGLDQRGAIVLWQKWSRGQIEARLANIILTGAPMPCPRAAAEL
jgi:transposase